MDNRLTIGILRLGTLGDLILSTPIFYYIKKYYPNSFLTLIVGNRNKVVLSSNPYIDEVIVWNKSPFFLPGVIHKIKGKKFNFYIDPKDHYSKESQIIARIINAEIKIGLNPPGKSIFDFTIPSSSFNNNLHYTQIVFNALRPLNIHLEKATIPKPQVFSDPVSQKYVDFYLKAINCEDNNYVVINFSASNLNKMISADKLIKAIMNSKLIDVELCKILTFTKKHKRQANQIKEAIPEINLFPSRNFNDIVALVRNSKAVITPDTSIVHVASAFEKPLLAFYSGLENFFIKFRPINPNANIVKAKEGDDGLHSITIQQIINSINNFITNGGFL